MKKSIAILAAAGLTLSAAALAAEKPSVDLGKRLFNDAHLAQSDNDRSCATCHADGAKLEKADKNPDLAGQINRCIQGALGGKPLDRESADMQSLVMYVQSLSKKAPAQ